ncbi:hypothetical protein D3C71_1820260 [compost metagenome]
MTHNVGHATALPIKQFADLQVTHAPHAISDGGTRHSVDVLGRETLIDRAGRGRLADVLPRQAIACKHHALDHRRPISQVRLNLLLRGRKHLLG